MLGFYFSCHLPPKALWLFEKEIAVRRACYSQYRIYRPLPFPAGQVFRPEKAAVNVDKSQSHEKKLSAILSAPSIKTGGTGSSSCTPKSKNINTSKIINMANNSVLVPGAT